MKCRLCKAAKITPVLNLGTQPLANKYPQTSLDISNEKKFEMKVNYCLSCYSMQLEKLSAILRQSNPVICEVMYPENQENVRAVKNEDGSMTSKPLEDMYPFLDREEFLSGMINKPI